MIEEGTAESRRMERFISDRDDIDKEITWIESSINEGKERIEEKGKQRAMLVYLIDALKERIENGEGK